MNDVQPLISIVVLVYNIEDYIGKCMESIVAQSYANLEVVVVDDGSPDGSSAIIDRFAESDDRIKIFRKKNEGIVLARRDGIAASTGDYVFFLDGDDYIAADCIERLYEAIKDGCGISCCQLIRVKDGYSSQMLRNTGRTAEGLGFLKHLLSHDTHAGVSGMMYRRDLLEGLAYYPEIRLWEDFLMNIQIAMKPNIGCVKFTLDAYYYYIQRPGSLTRARDSFDYLARFSSLVKNILNSNPAIATECKNEMLLDRMHWYYIYIKKSRNQWIGGTEFAKELRRDVMQNREQLKDHARFATWAMIKWYRYAYMRPLIMSASTIRRLKQSLERRIRK